MEDEHDHDMSTAMVVDSTDLRSVMTESDMQESSLQELTNADFSQSTTGSQEEDDEVINDEENDDRIRRVTHQYLEGGYSYNYFDFI